MSLSEGVRRMLAACAATDADAAELLEIFTKADETLKGAFARADRGFRSSQGLKRASPD